MAFLIRLAKASADDDVATDGNAWALGVEQRFTEKLKAAFDHYREACAAAVRKNPREPDYTDADQGFADEYQAAIEDVINIAGSKASDALGSKKDLIVNNPYAEAWITEHTADLVTQVTGATKEAIADAVHAAFLDGVTIPNLAKDIEPLIGLLPQHAQAVENFRAELEAQGAENVDEQVSDYADDLLSYRATNIARTETLTALNAGSNASWQQASDEGLIPPDTKRRWIAGLGERTCPICSELNGQEVPLGEPFKSSILGAVDGAPAHPQCRCTEGLVFSTTKRLIRVPTPADKLDAVSRIRRLA